MTPVTITTRQPWLSDSAARKILATLAVTDTPAALFVGGCVRDALLGRVVTDVDIATIHPPEEVMRRLDAAGIGYHTIGVDHGTVGAHAGGRTYEITTLRVDFETDGRHATVAYTLDWELDAARRDFTMNALYADGDGNIYDPLGGISDLMARYVRFIGDPRDRIREDALRILRFFRFNAQLNNSEMDDAGLAACLSHAQMLAELSGERLRDELRKLLISSHPANVFAVFVPHGLLGDALSCLRDKAGLAALTWIEDEYAEPDFVRRVCVLMEDGCDPRSIAIRLCLTKSEAHQLVSLSERIRDLDPSISDELQRQRLYRLGAAVWRDQVLLNWAMDRGYRDANRTKAWAELLSLPDNWSIPVFPLRGSDVLTLGVAPGPEISRLLTATEMWWISGGFIADRDACLAALSRQVKA